MKIAAVSNVNNFANKNLSPAFRGDVSKTLHNVSGEVVSLNILSEFRLGIQKKLSTNYAEIGLKAKKAINQLKGIISAAGQIFCRLQQRLQKR